MRLRKGLVPVLLVAAVAVAATAAVAYACAPQATIRLDTPAAGAKSEVRGNGSGFPAGVPVEVNVDDVRLWSGTPDALGRFNFVFRAPDLEPGYYVVTAAPVGYAGDPARAVLEITGAGTGQPGGTGIAPDPRRGAPSQERVTPVQPQLETRAD